MSQRDAQRTLLARQSTSYLQKAKNGYILYCVSVAQASRGEEGREETLSVSDGMRPRRAWRRASETPRKRAAAQNKRVCAFTEHSQREGASASQPRERVCSETRRKEEGGGRSRSARGATDRRGVSRGISGRTGAECTSQASRGEGVGLSAPSGGGHAREEHAADRDLLLGADVLEDHRARLVARLERRRARDVVAVPELTVREAVLDGERLHDARDAQARWFVRRKSSSTSSAARRAATTTHAAAPAATRDERRKAPPRGVSARVG